MKNNFTIQMFCTFAFMLLFYKSNCQGRYYTPPPPREYNLYTPDYNMTAQLLELERKRTEEAEEEAIKAKYKGKLHLYGGTNGHQIYFGCLDCPSYDPISIWNYPGNFGKGASNSTENIWNEFSPYGGTTSNYSPWSSTASSPPAIVDFDGNFYGYFTANTFKDKRTDIGYCNKIAENYSATKTNYQETGARFK